MPEYNPLKNTLDKIAETLDFIAKNIDKPTKNLSKKEFQEYNKKLQEIAAILVKKNKEFSETLALTEAENQILQDHPQELDPQTQELLKKAKSLTNEIYHTRNEVVAKAERLKGAEAVGEAVDQFKDKEAKKRRGRAAKNLGGKGWQRL